MRHSAGDDAVRLEDEPAADPFDIDLRAIMAFREIGKGHSGLETFCGYMNMPPPMAETTYKETVQFTLHPRYVVAARNMKDAAKEVRREILDDYDENAVCNQRNFHASTSV